MKPLDHYVIVGMQGVFDVAHDVQAMRQSVRPEVAVHREAVYDEIIHLLLESSAEELSRPVRIYVPVGLLVPDAA